MKQQWGPTFHHCRYRKWLIFIYIDSEARLLSSRNKKYVKKRFIDKYIFFMVIIFIYNGISFWITCVKIQITSYFLYIRSSSLIYSRCSCVSFSHSCLFLPLWIQTPLLFICLIYSLFFLFSFFWLITGSLSLTFSHFTLNHSRFAKVYRLICFDITK